MYVDSPLAVEATKIYQDNLMGYYDKETLALVKQGINPISFPGLRLSVTSEESKAINFDLIPKVIISASGMCEAGRIRHHLKHNLWRENSTILFVGYQAEGTFGRKLINGAKHVSLFGEEIQVNDKGCYPDGGMSFETYTNSLFLEMESLGELQTIMPGETVWHTENWSLYKESLPILSDKEIDSVKEKYIK